MQVFLSVERIAVFRDKRRLYKNTGWYVFNCLLARACLSWLSCPVAMGSLSNAVSPTKNGNLPNIIDIRSDTAGFNLKKDILQGLNPKHGNKKTLPTLLLYDDSGLRLFEEITYLDQYYLTGQEIELLEQYAERIAERIPNGSMVVELGSGYVANPFSSNGRLSCRRLNLTQEPSQDQDTIGRPGEGRKGRVLLRIGLDARGAGPYSGVSY